MFAPYVAGARVAAPHSSSKPNDRRDKRPQFAKDFFPPIDLEYAACPGFSFFWICNGAASLAQAVEPGLS